MSAPRLFKKLKSKPVLLIVPVLCLLAIPAVVIAVKRSDSPKENVAVSKQEVVKPVETKIETVTTSAPTATTPTQPAKTTQTQPQPTTPAAPEVKNPYQEGFGYWYVFNRRTTVGKPVGTTWVNPQQWLYYAKQDSYVVDKNPEKWAISVRSGGNVLAFVESVNDDGSLTMSAMNYTSGWYKTDTFQVSQEELAAWTFIH